MFENKIYINLIIDVNDYYFEMVWGIMFIIYLRIVDIKILKNF